MENRVRISREMAYLLRHDPSGMEVSEEGFADLGELLIRLQERWPELNERDVRELVEKDPKGRYEVRGGKIRACYGHSIDVNPALAEAEVDKLYHGTTPQASRKILEEGLRPKGRQKVHLSRSVEDAIEVGKRRADSPKILEVDVKEAREAGIRVERASDKVYVADDIPAEFISISPRSE